MREIISDLGRKIEISLRGSLFRFLSRIERPLHVEVSGKKPSEVWSAVGMAAGSLPVKKIFNGRYYEYLSTLYSSHLLGLGTQRYFHQSAPRAHLAGQTIAAAAAELRLEISTPYSRNPHRSPTATS